MVDEVEYEEPFIPCLRSVGGVTLSREAGPSAASSPACWSERWFRRSHPMAKSLRSNALARGRLDCSHRMSCVRIYSSRQARRGSLARHSSCGSWAIRFSYHLLSRRARMRQARLPTSRAIPYSAR